jgi:competence protein ComGF
VRGQTKIIADAFEKQRDNHLAININKKFDKFKDENKKGITNEPGQQAIPLCDREKSSKCQQQKNVESTFITLHFTSTHLGHPATN